MRVGFDVTALATPLSGVGVYTANLWAELGRNISDTVIPLTHRVVGGEWREAGGGWQVGRKGVNKTVWMQVLLPWQLRHLQLDVCHFTNNVAPVWGRQPTILTIHDMSLWLYPQYHYPKRLLAVRPILPLAARRAAAVITVSQSARADIMRLLKLPASKVHVVHEAPAPMFKPIPSGPLLEASRDRLRRLYQTPDRFVLYVGTIEPRKNLARLLEAFARLSPAPPHHLLLVGQRGWKDEAIYAAVERLDLAGRVRFLGFVPDEDLAALYNLADALVFPSLYEGFGLPVVEAMACGAPVITSNRGALAEIAGSSSGGRACAELVDPTDVASIQAGLERVMGDAERRAELRALGLSQAARFDWERTAAQTRAIYQHVVDGAMGSSASADHRRADY